MFSVASAFVALLAVLRDFGSGYYIATTRDLTQSRLNTAFTFSLLIGGVIFLVLQLVASAIGDFYAEPRVAELLRILAFNSPILAFSGCLMTLMRRHFLYGRVFWINLSGTLVGAVLTLLLAYIGWGATALAIGVTANYFVTAVMASLMKPSEHHLGFSTSGWRDVFSFGGKTSVIGLVQQLSSSILEMMVAKYLGFFEAGLLSRAMGVVNLFNRDFSEAIRSVAIHSFSREIRQGGVIESMHSGYLVNYSAFGIFYFTFIFLFPYESIYILSGDQWLGAVPYLQAFAIMGVITTLYQLLPVKAMASGLINKLVIASIISESVRLSLGGSALLFTQDAANYGYALAIASAFTAVVYWLFLGRLSRMEAVALATQLCKGGALAAIASGTTAIIIRVFLKPWLPDSMLLTGVLAGLIALSLFVVLMIVGNHPLARTIIHRLNN